jgi:hypothetical protein
VAYEDPQPLLARLRLGREEFAQRLLTSLILGGAYPRWNTRNTPSAAGVAFLRALDELCFGQPGKPAAVFVDELDLQRRHEDERGGAPDQAVLWDDRLWLIELKTEPRSHRRDQLPSGWPARQPVRLAAVVGAVSAALGGRSRVRARLAPVVPEVLVVQTSSEVNSRRRRCRRHIRRPPACARRNAG